MELLDQVYFQNTVRNWLIAAAVAVATTIVLKFLVAAGTQRLHTISERSRNDIDDIAVAVIGHTKFLFLLFLGIWTAARTLTLPDPVWWAIRVFGIIATVFQVASWGRVAIKAAIRQQVRRRLEDDPGSATAMNALGFLLQLALWAVLLLVALDNLGVEIGPFLAGLGVGGIAVALAVQNVLGDLFASLSIVLDKPFVIGDFIVVGDQSGTVENVGLKTTRVRSISGEQLVFANSDLLSSRIQNFKRMVERRIVFTIGVTYQTPRATIETVPVMIRETIEKQPNTRFDRAHFKEFAESSLNFEVVYFVLSREFNDYMNIQQAINFELLRRFEAEGIEFAYPSRTLYVERGESWLDVPDKQP
ncbi:MAG: mechanosensitive ion channel family protein [Longimicrobiales bacterium]